MAGVWPVPELPREIVDASVSVIYVLDAELRIAHCNPAWNRFALANEGEAALSEKVVGAPLFRFIPPILQGFYREVFAACAEDGEPFAFDYECSSPNQHRRFRMQVLPSKTAGGFGVINALRIEQPHGAVAAAPSDEYLSAHGIVTMCAHCRKTRSAKQAERWDWVPAYLVSREMRISHGLCPPCHSYHYDSVLRAARAVPRS